MRALPAATALGTVKVAVCAAAFIATVAVWVWPPAATVALVIFMSTAWSVMVDVDCVTRTSMPVWPVNFAFARSMVKTS
jgi:hypothetical protein